MAKKTAGSHGKTAGCAAVALPGWRCGGSPLWAMRRPLPARSPETGGGTRRAAEGEPEQAPTPTRARFEQAGSRLEMPQAWAPLDEEAGAAELTARLEQVLGDALPENLERLKPEMSMALSAHLHQHGLQREHDAPNVLSRNHRQAMLPPRPTFEQNSFFMNASQLDGAPPSGALLGYGVHSAGMKTLMLQRGYTEIKINHLPNDERTAPQSCRGQTQHQLPTEGDEPPNDRVIVPKKLPPMLRGANASTAAAQVVKQFEHSVKVEEDGKVVVYSPLRQWSKASRRGKLEATQWWSRLEATRST